MPTKKKAPAAKPEEAAKARKASPKPKHTEAYEQAIKDFSHAIELLRQGDYAKAREIFAAVRKENPDEPVLAARSATYAAICARKLAPSRPEPQTAEELYFAGVLSSNEGRLPQAIAFLDRAIQLDGSSASFLYARAAARALFGLAEGAASDLRQAISLDPRCRFQAANDPDFDKVRDEAAFIDVIEPTPDDK
jgi:tetratricopeptide (TPR) repeat protein